MVETVNGLSKANGTLLNIVLGCRTGMATTPMLVATQDLRESSVPRMSLFDHESSTQMTAPSFGSPMSLMTDSTGDSSPMKSFLASTPAKAFLASTPAKTSVKLQASGLFSKSIAELKISEQAILPAAKQVDPEMSQPKPSSQ